MINFDFITIDDRFSSNQSSRSKTVDNDTKVDSLPTGSTVPRRKQVKDRFQRRSMALQVIWLPIYELSGPIVWRASTASTRTSNNDGDGKEAIGLRLIGL